MNAPKDLEIPIEKLSFWMENFDIERMLWMKKRKFILAGQAC